MNPYRAETHAKANRNERKAEAVRMYSQGVAIKAIAQAISKSERTVRDWLKPYRQLEHVAA
ncbi:helix-turn-helix domain-containing protein [Pseudomonas sp. NY15437]|uniref:helix-turn-helix domain-containing protein n=1 Tax=Pseudomonas sp. NY15437 TaxID=3400360 RepID=UPI003A8B75A7